MKAILYFVLIGAIIGIWIFSSVPALYWTLYGAFIIGGIKIVDKDDNVRQLNYLLTATNLFLLVKLVSLLIWWMTNMNFGPLETLYPWSIGVSTVFTGTCLIFGYIARYNMSKEAQQLRALELEEELEKD